MEQPDVCEESCLLFVGTAILRNMSAIYRVRPKEMIGHQIGKYPIRIINPVTVNAVYEGPKNTTLRLRKRAGGHNDDIHIATAKSDGSGPMSLTATLTPGFYAWDIYAPPRTAGPFLSWIQKVDMSKQSPPSHSPHPRHSLTVEAPLSFLIVRIIPLQIFRLKPPNYYRALGYYP
eukprot:comp4815_c0_seq1/m.941 comp4815_c0_seq1/g.941  ORF comp4815_c0_seq1/g.941 comp4815_c0_seq1/m.941 type:complete len:175 (-) comp4815_c0_seq1:88-612(-)